ncbi:tRNA (adenosine(37)-N6)-threonylcarbamoyltransferase complex dimerization subunit type 1 TsaB [Aquaticitalea lipolytica]|jgi:tRNA threonylcarbamoyladenosine biosynthesis protein TsaB|uniref:tRNA (Adenosine(37)-N6)-threonylcarbamoyltransferase complex dimerization subunit type 1 TsaB n=1 Tax=Aquaticitalea lipolytica TaxID=1247562 RepID=A0A8J2TTN4_9FLAO|nr:tRNA (adenosine(37)-N6)-threonylcarbamoyltransferase complex dimerization subunit type 1 TsaB [Aquaticitalea lipolytica]GFZ90240.1 tRNA (adenosine(37)-N6)-threonylcarbamoyltransferase complex dimerization subunit type 1 TsaB [Aquaticitalea lipolytica]
MSYILNIETATTNCSVSLSKEGEILVLKEDYNTNYSHAESLHMFIEEVIIASKIKPSQIDAIAVSKGPGSYTGLRIGVSAAKGLCYALNKPLISVATLQSLANQVTINDGIIVAMLDARRLEVYSAIFDKNHNKIRETKAQILDENSFKDYLEKGKVYFIGDGVEKTKTLIKHSNAIYIEDKLPSAKEMSKLSYDKYKKNDIEDVAYFEPYYLKDFIGLKQKS